MKRYIIGCGYLGGRVVADYQARGASVWAVVASEKSALALRARGIEAQAWDLDRKLPAALETDGSELIYLAPPPPTGREEHRVARLLAHCDALGAPRRILYLSTSGVYGDCGGAWVDETRPPEPVADRAFRRLDGERRFQNWCLDKGCQLVILRVAGIYGPGRLPLERLRQGLPTVVESEAPYTNRIHVADLAAVILAAMERGGDREIYNASDGNPGNMTDYFNRVADHAGLPRPPQIPLAEAEGRLSPGMLSYMRESRRLSNRKLLERLGVSLRYPTLEQGLAGCAD